MVYLEDFYVGDVATDAIHPSKFMKFVCKQTDKDIPVFVECQVREGERQFRWWWNGPWISIPDNKIFDTGVSTDFKHTAFLESFYAFNFSSSAFGGFESYKSKDAVRGTPQRGIIPKNSYIWYCGEQYISDRLIVNFNKELTMSLDEAIEHCREKSCSNNTCALEHKQLAEWLIELKELRSQITWKPSDLPHWKKSNLPNDNTTGFNSDYFCYKGYSINYKELFEKLLKDD